ncbi:MAG: hypothetical protein JNM17_08935 [Archangium sp.]|nr:hypothetical protein [Archangium sp.]
MADALPPETAKVQIETLKAFSQDIELSMRSKAKAYDIKPVEIVELRAWIDLALASNTDGAVRPKEGLADVPHLNWNNEHKLLEKLKERVNVRIGSLEAGNEFKETAKEFIVSELAKVSEGLVTVPATKSGGVRVASVEEVKSWLAGTKWVASKPRPKSKD